jgi:hypothetical protein
MQMVDEMVKQAKMRRKNGGKKEVCVFCRNNGEKEQIYTSHTLKDANSRVACPILRLYQCPICHASGDQAHTIKYCPFAEKDNACIKYRDNRMSISAAYLMSELANGTNGSPGMGNSLMQHQLDMSPPESPSPTQIGNMLNNYLSADVSNDINGNGCNAGAYPFNQLVNLNGYNFNMPSPPLNHNFGQTGSRALNNSLLAVASNAANANAGMNSTSNSMSFATQSNSAAQLSSAFTNKLGQ